MTDPEFLEDDHPSDGSRSVTSMGSEGGPLRREPVDPSHGSSLATPGLGVHEMDDTADDTEDSTEEDDDPTVP
jgi:hypothetical protein